MKILTLSNCDLVASQGSGYVITGFVEGLREMGCEVKAVGPDNLAVCPGVSSAKLYRLTLGMWWKGVRLIREFKPDVVEFYGGSAWLATWLWSLSRREFLVAAHSNGLETFAAESLRAQQIHNTLDGRPPKWRQKLLGRLNQNHLAFTKADVIVTVCESERDFALRRGYQPADRVLAINNALPKDLLGQPAGRNDSKTIGFCGSWIVRKGIGILVPALIKVLAQAPGWSVQLVGVGDKFNAADHFPGEIADRIKIEPFVKDKTRLVEIYRSWAIAVMPSFYESFGLVAAEAMACGCALVATRTGFPAELADDFEACLVEPTTNSLIKGLQRLIAHPELRTRIALAGQRRVQSLSWPENVKRLHDFYLEHLPRHVKSKQTGSGLKALNRSA